MASIGQIIDDKYEILKLIGQGGMSKVYLAMDKRLNKQWAVKEIQKKARDKNNEVVIQSAIAEANMIKQLDHSSIVRIVDIIENPDVIYIIEDYIEGETLNTILENNGAQPQELVIEWAMQICDALEYLHTRKPAIIYRDMKPANVMLKPDGNIKIIDFGIAREYKEQSLADTVSLGTKGYAAPEQFGGKGQTDARTDVYCLGVTLYHLVTGQSPCEPPYEIYPIRHWNPQLSAGLEAIIEKCTQLNPDDRYQTCAELLYALHHYEEYGVAYRARQKKKLGAFIATSAACMLFALVGVLGITMRTATINADYKTYITQGDKASTSEEKVKLYSQAIALKPDSIEVYQKVIDAMESDKVFTSGGDNSEEKILMNLINPNLSDLEALPEYSDLAFRIGELYWYFYDYGQTESNTDNQTTRIGSATKWFEEVDESSANYSIAHLYSEIGDFTQNIEIQVNKAKDAGMYAKYWERISELVGMLYEENNKGERVLKDGLEELYVFETFRLAQNSIETYSRKFKSDKVTQSDIMDVYNPIYDTLSKNSNESGYLEATSDKTVEIKKALLARIGLQEDNNGVVTEIEGKPNSVLSAIENAYRE